MSESTKLEPSDAQSILRARARALARPPQDAPVRESFLEVLAFSLGDERYALEVHAISGVEPLRNLTPLPHTPPFIRGIVNVRGRLVPVFDLKKLFDLPETGLTDLHCVIVVATVDVELGILADAINGVRSLPLETLQPPLPTFTSIGADYLKGVTPDGVIVLDARRIMTDPRIMVDQNTGT